MLPTSELHTLQTNKDQPTINTAGGYILGSESINHSEESKEEKNDQFHDAIRN